MKTPSKALFVCSGNSKAFKIAPFIYEQGESLKSLGIDLKYFIIHGKGIIGYLKNIAPLRALLRKEKFDIIHAHYSFSGWVAVLAAAKLPVIVSLMGDDAYGSYNSKGKIKCKSIFVIIMTKILLFFVDYIIVKSENLKKTVFRKNQCDVIPNGVDINKFKPINKKIARKKLNLDGSKKILLFLGNPKDTRKNFKLIIDAYKLIGNPDLTILSPYPVEHSKIPLFLNAADALILTSFNEGSPNVIKEAMACNCPIVATNVGDVKWVIGNTDGCYITTFDPKDVATKIELALDFSKKIGKTNGRERIINLGLDLETTANKILDIYINILEKEKKKNYY